MASRNERERREVRYASAKDAAEKHLSGFEATSIAIPEGAHLFSLGGEDTRYVDILPYIVGKGNPYADEGLVYYERTYFVHRGIGPDENSYVCSRKTFGGKCAICDETAYMRKRGEGHPDALKELEPKERQLWNLIDSTNDKEEKKGIQLWDISFHLFGKLLNKRIKRSDERDGYERFFHLKDGMTLRIEPTEKKYGSATFYEVSAIEFRNRREDLPERILDESYCLDDLLKEMDYEELKKIFLDGPDPTQDPKGRREAKREEKGKDGDRDRDRGGDRDRGSRDDDRGGRSRDDDRGSSRDRDRDDDRGRGRDRDEDRSSRSRDDDRSSSRGRDRDEDRPSRGRDDKQKDRDRGGEKPPPSGARKDEPTADAAGIEVGTKVSHKEFGDCEVLHVSGDGTALRLEDKDGNVHRGVGPEEVEVLADDDKGSKGGKGKGDESPARGRGAKDEPEDKPAGRGKGKEKGKEAEEIPFDDKPAGRGGRGKDDDDRGRGRDDDRDRDRGGRGSRR